MSEWDAVISVLGTLGGTALGLVLGYLTTSQLETRRQKNEREMEYKKELTRHMDDIIKPLFHYIEELWGSLSFLAEAFSTKSPNVKFCLIKTQKAEENLKQFYVSNYAQLDLLLPQSISPWVFAPIEEHLDDILVRISRGMEPKQGEFALVINALMEYQKNLKRLLGYETMEKLKEIYPFKQQEKPRST